MSSRKAIVATVRKSCDPGEHPNRYVGQITAQVRVHFPPHAHPADVRTAVARAVRDTYRALGEWEAGR